MTVRLLSHNFTSTKALCSAYMPFITYGGLFIPTREKFELGESIIADIHLLDEPDRQQIKGVVVWLTPKGAQGGEARWYWLAICRRR
jgi:type IV pilus assembly protein PilZ